MGQLVSTKSFNDNRPRLSSEIPQDNVTQIVRYEQFLVCSSLLFFRPQKIFYIDNDEQIEVIYKFGPRYKIHINLTKRQVKKDKGIFIKISDQFVYAYKHKKLDRADKIKPQRILFRKRLNQQKTQISIKNKAKAERSQDMLENTFDQEKHDSKDSQKKKLESKKNSQQIMLRRFAEIKLLSLLNIGPKLGRSEDGADGIYTEKYIQYFSQITIEKIENCIAKESQLKTFIKRLFGYNFKLAVSLTKQQPHIKKQQKSEPFITLEDHLELLSYSRWRKGYVLKLQHYYDQRHRPVQTTNASYQNRSINYLISKFQTEINMAIMDLNNQTKMLSAVNNLIFQNDISGNDGKSLNNNFEQNLEMIADVDERDDNTEETSGVSSSRQSNSMNKKYEKMLQKKKSNSSRDSFQNILNSDSNVSSVKTYHIPPELNTLSVSNETINDKNLVSNRRSRRQSLERSQQHSGFEASKNQRKKSIRMRSEKKKDSLKKDKSKDERKPKSKGKQKSLKKIPEKQSHKKIQFDGKQEYFEGLKRLKTAILDKNKQSISFNLKKMQESNYKSNIQIQIAFSKILMHNGKSRYALAIMQKILRFSNQASLTEIYYHHQIALQAGIIYYHRGSYQKSLKEFQKCLTILIKLGHYSIKIMNAHNNIACLHHILKNYENSILHLHRGFRIGEYSADYEFLMRSNMAMSLAEKGRIKQAKLQMLKTNKIVQPVNNMVVFCKFYSNLAYLELLDKSESKSLEKAISHFQEACNIQDKFLIPSGYRPSIFLHNNMSMLHYKRRQFKKAKHHCEKILEQLNQITGIMAVRVHFNIAKIFSQGYNIDLPEKHLLEAKIFFFNDTATTEKPGLIKKYKDLIQHEINDLEKLKIEEVSEQESYHKVSYMSSSLLKKK